jgi:hypothetical protein
LLNGQQTGAHSTGALAEMSGQYFHFSGPGGLGQLCERIPDAAYK